MAQTAPAKKMLIMNILDILKRYTDKGSTGDGSMCYAAKQFS